LSPTLWDNQGVKIESSKTRSAFTLVELMIVMTIAIILSVIGYVNITSRLRVSRLENAVQTMVSDLSYGRSAAMLKGCSTRFIFCNDRLCADKALATDSSRRVTALSPPKAPARYYAILRRSQASNPAESCFSATAVNAVAGGLTVTGDGFDFWDFDRRPQSIPVGVSFFGIYPSANLLDQTDWNFTISPAADNSIWFNSSGDLTTAGLTDTANVAGSAANYRIAFQLGLDDCSAADDDCTGYLVSIPPNGGTAKFTKCEKSALVPRSSGMLSSNKCF